MIRNLSMMVRNQPVMIRKRKLGSKVSFASNRLPVQIIMFHRTARSHNLSRTIWISVNEVLWSDRIFLNKQDLNLQFLRRQLLPLRRPHRKPRRKNWAACNKTCNLASTWLNSWLSCQDLLGIMAPRLIALSMLSRLCKFRVSTTRILSLLGPLTSKLTIWEIWSWAN